jgi:hypothetical protein
MEFILLGIGVFWWELYYKKSSDNRFFQISINKTKKKKDFCHIDNVVVYSSRIKWRVQFTDK